MISVHFTQLHLSFVFLRANASLNLERQINKVDGLVSGFEQKLSDDGPIPDVPSAVQIRADDIQVRKSAFIILPHIKGEFDRC